MSETYLPTSVFIASGAFSNHPQLLRNGHSGHAHASGNAQITVEKAFLMDISSLAHPPTPPVLSFLAWGGMNTDVAVASYTNNAV